MTTESGANLVVAQQLEALAIAAKNYTLAEIANSGGGSAATVIIGSVSSTVEGAFWLEDDEA